ncbi:MAG TPA: GAF domain-containing protein, partial [Solirubrobacteraceae bacterium]
MSIAVRPEFDQPFTTASSLRRVQESLAQLSRTEALWQVVLDTPAEACAACGMDRAMLTHVRDGQIAFASVSTEHDPQLAAAFAKTGRSMRVALVDCPAELEVVTTQRPLVVSDLESANHEVAELARTAGYVVAPIVQGGQTIGLLHADRLFSGEEITEFDRDLLWTFATGVGWAMRQAV